MLPQETIIVGLASGKPVEILYMFIYIINITHDSTGRHITDAVWLHNDVVLDLWSYILKPTSQTLPPLVIIVRMQLFWL